MDIDLLSTPSIDTTHGHAYDVSDDAPMASSMRAADYALG